MIFRLSVAVLVFLITFAPGAGAQTLQARADEIRAAMDRRDFARAEQAVRDLRAADEAAFARNNYDYLLARLNERRGARAEAAALYLGLLSRNSSLSDYALWHLAGMARAASDLALERQYLTRLLTTYRASALTTTARSRLTDSHLESGNAREAIGLLRPAASPSGVHGRRAMARLGEAYGKLGDVQSARAVFAQLVGASRDDYALAAALD